MMISGMTGIAGASEISASGSTQQVSTEAEAASAEGSGSSEKVDKEKESEKEDGKSKDSQKGTEEQEGSKDSQDSKKESGKPADGDSKKNAETKAETGEKKTESDKTEKEKDEEKSEKGDSVNKEESSADKEENSAEKEEESEPDSQSASKEDPAAEDADKASTDDPAASGTDEKPEESAEKDEEPAEKADKDAIVGDSTVGNVVAPVVEADQAGEAVSTDPVGTMLPIEEKKAYLVLHGYSDEELKNMPVTTMLEKMMDEEGKPLSLPDDAEMVWTHYKDNSGNLLTDEYHKISKDETVDLTDLKDAGVYRMEMIVGSGNQLDPGNIRYLVSVYFTVNEHLHFELYTEENGTRKKINSEDVQFIKTKDSGYVNQNGDPIEAWVYYIIPEGKTSMDDLYLGVTSSIEELPFVDIEVYDTIEVFRNKGFSGAHNIHSTVMNQDMSASGAGYHLQYDPYNDYTQSFGAFALIYNVAGIVDTRPVMFLVSHGCMEAVPSLHTVDENQETVPVTESITNNIALQLSSDYNDDFDCLLLSGYSAEDTYQLSLDVVTKTIIPEIKIESGELKVYVDHEEGDNMNSKVTRAVVGNFTSAEEVMEQPDIKDQLFSKEGYSGSFAGDGIVFTLYFGGDWQPGTGDLYWIKVTARGNETSMKDYDEAPVVGSQDPWFHMTGLKLDGRELDTYIVENGKSINMDTYYGYGYQTVMVNEVLTEDEIARLVPIFEVGDPDRVEIRLPGSDKELVSGQSQVDFSGKSKSAKDDDIANMVAIIDGHTKNYQVRVISKMSGPKLYVYDDYTDQGGDRFREILLNDYFEEKHDILIANVGDAPLTGLKAKLELDENANHVKLDDYWNIGGNGNDTLEPFTTTEDLSTYGMIPNVAKVRLIPDGEGDIEGKLIISADGQDDVVIYLSNHARQPEIINDNSKKLEAVRWVPYSYIMATNNMYDWNEQTFSISEGELPPGMELNPETGEIYGAPTTEEERDYEYTFTVRATYSRDDYFQPSEKEFTILVRDNEDETVYDTSDTTYEIYADENLDAYEDQSSYVGEQVSDYRFEISSFDYDEVYVSRGEFRHFTKLWLNGEVLDESAYQTFEGSTVIVINREVLEEKSNKNGERNTISAEFDEEGERGDDMKRTSQNYYVVEDDDEESGNDDTGSDETEEQTPSTPSDTLSDENEGGDDSGTQTQPVNDRTNDDGADSGSGADGESPAGNTSDGNNAGNSNNRNNGNNSNNGNSNRNSGNSNGGSGNSGSGSASSSTAAAVTINAKLVDAAGTALSGYTLEMHSTVKKGQTNGAGIAKFSGMEMGSHTVYVLNTGGDRLASQQFQLKQGTRFARSGNTITVVPGQTISMTITLNGSTATITDVSVAAGPATGDTSDVEKWGYLFIAAALGACILFRLKKGRA